METNQWDVKDDNFVIVKYDRNTDVRINKSATGIFESWGIVTFDINYGNSWSDQQDNIIITDYLSGGMTGYSNNWRTLDWTGYQYNLGSLDIWQAGSLVFTAMIITGQEWWIRLENTINIDWYYFDLSTGNNTYTTWFYTLDTLAPYIYFTGSTPASGTASQSTTFTGQVEVIEKYLSWVIRYRSGVYAGTWLNFDIWNLPDGTYTYQVCAEDQAGNIGCTKQRDYTVDNIYPRLELISPINNMFFNYTPTSIDLLRSGSDIPAGISGYYFEVYSGWILQETWSTTETGTTFDL